MTCLPWSLSRFQQEILERRLAEMRWLKNKVFFGSISRESPERLSNDYRNGCFDDPNSIGAVTTHGASDDRSVLWLPKAERGTQALAGLLRLRLGWEKESLANCILDGQELPRRGNWDGYGAAPVSADAYALACRFLGALPLGIAGSVRRRRAGWPPDSRVVSLAASLASRSASAQKGICTTPPSWDRARLMAPRRSSGTFPVTILDLIHRVQAA